MTKYKVFRSWSPAKVSAEISDFFSLQINIYKAFVLASGKRVYYNIT